MQYNFNNLLELDFRTDLASTKLTIAKAKMNKSWRVRNQLLMTSEKAANTQLWAIVGLRLIPATINQQKINKSKISLEA